MQEVCKDRVGCCMFMGASSVYIERYSTTIIRAGCLMPEVLKVWPLVGNKTHAEGACLQRPRIKDM